MGPLLWAEAALAQEYGATAKVVRPVASRHEEDVTAAATSVDLTSRPLSLETLRDVVPEVPGAIAFTSGGYGSVTNISLRGTDVGHTVWLLGDVPLNGPDTGAFDMSLLPLPQLARLEVYRGGAPVWYGQGSIGGVVRVVPREGEGTGATAQLGGGSFGLMELRGGSYVARQKVSLYTGVQTTHAQNDYPYQDDHADRFDVQEQTRRLQNADVNDASGVLHARIAVGGGHLDVIGYGIERMGGVPGPAGQTVNARHTHRTLQRSMFAVSYARDGKLRPRRRYRTQLVASVQDEQRTLDDPYGELLGSPLAMRQGYLRGALRGAGTLQLARFLEGTVIGTYVGDRFDGHDALGPSLTGPSTRNAGAVAAELRLFGRPLGWPSELRGSVRSEWNRTALQIVQISRLEEETKQQQVSAYRLAFSTAPLPGLNLRGSAGNGSRVPSITELFGDGGTLLANPNLVPEQGVYADGGFVLAEALGPVCVSLEANGFASRVTDKIVYVTTSQFTSVAKNLGDADVVGAEIGGELAHRDVLRVVGSSTYTHSKTNVGDDTRLPRQPTLMAYGRIEGSAHFSRALNRLTVYSMVDHVSLTYLDAANRWPRQPLTHVGLGVALAFWQDRMELAARAHDIFNVAGVDYQRYPLPGRSFQLVASFREESK